MSKRAREAEDALWLWDGHTEYDGHLISLDGVHLAARIRQIGRPTRLSHAPGRAVPQNLLERQRHLARSLFFGQSPLIHLGALLEFRVGTVQPSPDPQFDYVLSGTFLPVPEEHLETLSHVGSHEAIQYLRSRRNDGLSVESRRLRKQGKTSFGM